MIPRDFAEIYLAEQAHTTGRATPGGKNNYQMRFSVRRAEVSNSFDTLVSSRDQVVIENGLVEEHIFQPYDLGKFTVGRARSQLFAQLSRHDVHPFEQPKKVYNHLRSIGIYAAGTETAATEAGWTFVRPLQINKSVGFIGRLTLDNCRWRAIPTSVALLNEFSDTLGHIINTVSD